MIGVRAFAALALAGALAACAASSYYMGIPLAGGAATPDQMELRSLAMWARAGDKQAQLELGIAFEDGRMVARDLQKAKALYELAAFDGRARVWTYLPPVGNAAAGRVVPVEIGPLGAGLPEAQMRLARLRASQASRDD